MLQSRHYTMKLRVTAIFAVVALMTVVPATEAEAASCPGNRMVGIASNTTIDALHMWSTGDRFYEVGGSHFTRTGMISTWIGVGTSGNLNWAYSYCYGGSGLAGNTHGEPTR